MAYICGECSVWLQSKDANRYGERYCTYDGKYRSADQNIYGCRGFVYAKPSGGGCFLTTACVEHKGLQDDCRELTAMRHFRDNWLAMQPGGRKEIDAYYCTAPNIVARIHARTDAANVLENLYQWHILPCVVAVEAGDMEKAHELYKTMVKKIEKEV